MLTSEEQQNDKPSTSTTKAAVAGREVKKAHQVIYFPGEKPRKLSFANDLRSCFTLYRVFSFKCSPEADFIWPKQFLNGH